MRDPKDMLTIGEAAKLYGRGYRSFKADCERAGILVKWGAQNRVHRDDVVRMLTTPAERKVVTAPSIRAQMRIRPDVLASLH